MNSKRGFLILNGVKFTREVLQYYWQSGDLIVAADGGGWWLKKNNLVPDYLVGDFDSLPLEVVEYFKKQGSKVEYYAAKKDHTDGYLGLQWLINQGVESIYVLGGMGNRLDQLMGFLDLIPNYQIPIYYLTENSTATVLRGEYIITSDVPVGFSLILLDDSIITLEGVEYPLNYCKIKKGSDLTISNFMLDKEIKLISDQALWFIGLGLNLKFEKCQ